MVKDFKETEISKTPIMKKKVKKKADRHHTSNISEGQLKMAKWHNNSAMLLKVEGGLHRTWSKMFNMYAQHTLQFEK